MNHHPIISEEAMRRWENEAFGAGHSAEMLMEEAGLGAAEWLRREYPKANCAALWIGKGNNGGDGLGVARWLALWGWKVRVWFAFTEDSFSVLGKRQLNNLRESTAGLDVTIANPVLHPPYPSADGVLVDALLGIGLKGSLHGSLREVVGGLNEHRRVSSWNVVALDVPSGLNEATKEQQDAVVADVTLTLGFPKEMLAREDKSDWVGRLEVIPLTGAQPPQANTQLISPASLATSFPRRRSLTNKGSHGRVVIAGGSRGFSGAPVLSALGALRCGAGLVSIVTSKDSQTEVACRAPAEVMVSSWDDPHDFLEKCSSASAVVVGPGMGLGNEAAAILERLLTSCQVPMVLDADALTLLSRHALWRNAWLENRVLTPHPGEAARLMGRKFDPAERESVAAELAEGAAGGLILKGVRTVIAQSGHPLLLNSTGNAGLAKGGTGDVLAGMVGAFLAQKFAVRDAMALAAWLHGRSADLLLRTTAMESMLASEVANGVSGAIADLRSRAMC